MYDYILYIIAQQQILHGIPHFFQPCWYVQKPQVSKTKNWPGIGSLVSEDAEINETGEERYRSTVMVQMLGISPQWLNGNPFVEEIHHGNTKLLIHHLDLGQETACLNLCVVFWKTTRIHHEIWSMNIAGLSLEYLQRARKDQGAATQLARLVRNYYCI